MGLGVLNMALTNHQKAVRREFRDTYGSLTVAVVDRLRRGWDTERIAHSLGVSRGTVIATKANLTRGAYDDFVTAAGF